MSLPRAFVFDIDGVLKTTLKGALPHAQDTLDGLSQKGIPYRLMTNFPFLDQEAMEKRMNTWGLKVDPMLIYGAAHPLNGYLERNPLRSNNVWSIGLEDPAPFLNQYGLKVANHLEAKELGAMVLFDDDYWWDTEKISLVFNLLLADPKLPLIIPNPDLLFPERPGHFMLTSGSIGQLLQNLCEAKGRHLSPIYLGKPHLPLFRMTQEALAIDLPNLKPEQIAMVGDTPATDILGGNQAGWQTWLVKTGGFRYGEHFEGAQPNRVFENLLPILEEINSSHSL